MMHTTQALYDTTRSCLVDIEQQIQAVEKLALLRLPVHATPEPGYVYGVTDRDGKPVMQDLLLAKAHCLSALATLKAASQPVKR